MKRTLSNKRRFGAISIWCLASLATAVTALAQQVQVDGKTLVDNKNTVDNKTVTLAPPAFVYVIPQMIGDHGFGMTLNPVKIGENESPRPLDRIFLTYNYFNDVQLGRRMNDDVQINVHRTVLGFEKAFFDDRFSFGARFPFSTIKESFIDDSRSDTYFGDISLIGKYSFWSDKTTGSGFSTGLSVTLPTETRESRSDDFIIQPFLGAVYNWSGFYIHGFSSVTIPTEDSRRSEMWLNDFGTGYYIYKSQTSTIRAVVPTLEVHVNTPLGGKKDFCSQVNLTAGVHLQIMDRTLFTVGGVVPVAGRDPFEYEFVGQFNYHF